MSYATSCGARVHWRQDGDPGTRAILLLNSIGTDLGMWDEVAANLVRDFHVLRTDARGHGATEPTVGDYSMDLLTADAVAVLDAAGVEQACVCGLSLGALVAAHLAKSYPKRVDALVLCNVATAFNSQDWVERARAVRASGIAPLIEASMGRFLSASFRESDPSRAEAVRAALGRVDPRGYAGCCMAIASTPTLPTDPAVAKVPLLAIGGAGDQASPPEHATAIAEAGNGDVQVLEGAHLSAVEDPAGFSSAVRAFLAKHGGNQARVDMRTQFR
jgi:3-oxoadipate enol-lactonase / 4-carboxymuconolactone decarboxylase